MEKFKIIKNKALLWLMVPLFCGYSELVNAQSVSSVLSVPNSGIYGGIGFANNSTQFNDQTIQATGVSTVTNTGSGAPVNAGTAGGPAVGVDMDSISSISPNIQAGYFQKFKDSNYLWGAKFSYNYLGGATSTHQHLRIPQYGSYSNGDPFTGNAVAVSYQKTINHQISLIPYIGKSFEKDVVSFGVGPSLSQVNTKINSLVGFADINGDRTDISGVAQNFSDTTWVYGGTLMMGASHFIDKDLFLELSYTYTMTQNKTSNYYSTFYNPSSPYTYSGSLIGSSTGTSTTQTIGFTINKIF